MYRKLALLVPSQKLLLFNRQTFGHRDDNRRAESYSDHLLIPIV